LTLGAQPFVDISSVCAIHIAADGTFDLVRILLIIGPPNPAMTTALLIVWVEVADLNGFRAPTLPFNWHTVFLHTDSLSQRIA